MYENILSGVNGRSEPNSLLNTILKRRLLTLSDCWWQLEGSLLMV